MRCKACKKAAYCSKLHQKLDWSRHKRVCNVENSVDSLSKEGGNETWLFPEYGLCVEQEEFDDVDIDESTNIWEDALTPGGKDEEDDAKLTQADYEKALGSESSDPVYIRFLTRVKRGGTDQVLRYCRWPKNGRGALPISSAASSDHLEPSPCERCGAPRSFECQIMPQLLHFLRIENRTKIAPSAEAARLLQQDLPSEEQVFQNALNEDIDWGTVDIYTCTESCQLGDESNAVEELVRIQAPPSAERVRLA
jgi:pre-rRNA-processing protein TSR4